MDIYLNFLTINILSLVTKTIILSAHESIKKSSKNKLPKKIVRNMA